MGLFVKKQFEDSTHYTLSSSTTLLIVGLGNPGKKYHGTRHNIGAECLDAFLNTQSEFSNWQTKKDLHSDISVGNFGRSRVILAKPKTFMNESGKSIKALVNYYKIELKNVTVVHDDIDIDFGQIRTRLGGSSAGNNGIKSAIAHIGSEFGRIRVGIHSESKPKDMETADFVLAKFHKNEQAMLKPLKREVQSILMELIYRSELYPDTRNFII